MQAPPVAFCLKETRGYGWKFNEDNLVKQTHNCLYVLVKEATDLPENIDPYVEIKLGNYKDKTHHLEKNSNPDWNKMFVFSNNRIQGSVLEIIVRDNDVAADDGFIGRVVFDLNEIPYIFSQRGPLAAQWYSLEDNENKRAKGELMLAVWVGGDQADEASHIGSSVYLSPKLWYLKVTIIEAKDLQTTDESRIPAIFVKAMLGNQTLRTTVSTNQSSKPMWNEDLVFVAADPFDVPLVLSIENRFAPNKGEIVGQCAIGLKQVDRRLDDRLVNSRWYNLERHVLLEDEVTFVGKIHVRIWLECGYYVPDESTPHTSDFRPTGNKSRIGVLELGILNAVGLPAMRTKDGRPTTDAYCVAKYGEKWVRTKTTINVANPVWNEEYSWEVFEPCTVVTIAVFDHCHLQGGRDSSIGKVRIRLSTLETNCVYTHSYPLLVLHPTGVKIMGEIHLAIRFTCSSWINMMYKYSQPLLQKMHYIEPLTASQLNKLRHQATQIVSTGLSQAEPPLKKEVVQYMLEAGFETWCMRKSKVNFYRIMLLQTGLVAFMKWLNRICNWENPITTVVIHILFIILVMYPHLILPGIFLYELWIVIWNYRWRPRHPPHVDTRLSFTNNAIPDEMEEEFDMSPSSYPADVLRMRYDRLRSIGGRIQTVLGDLVMQGERLHSLLCWRDPVATFVFAIFCLVAAIVLYTIPFEVVAILTGLYILRHPIFRHKHPSVPVNFFRRLPDRSDYLITK